MYNGSYSPSSLTETGSFYNGRVANTTTANESLNKTHTENICPREWTLMTTAQANTILNNYASSWNMTCTGRYGNSKLFYASIYSFFWARTAQSASGFYSIRSECTKNSISDYILDWNGAGAGEYVRCVAK